MPESLKIESKYQPWHSIRFAGVNENNSDSDHNKKYCTNNETKSVSTEDTASFTSDDESSKLQNIMESYTPYKKHQHNKFQIHG